MEVRSCSAVNDYLDEKIQIQEQRMSGLLLIEELRIYSTSPSTALTLLLRLTSFCSLEKLQLFLDFEGASTEEKNCLKLIKNLLKKLNNLKSLMSNIVFV